jgi:hypothetical protein
VSVLLPFNGCEEVKPRTAGSRSQQVKLNLSAPEDTYYQPSVGAKSSISIPGLPSHHREYKTLLGSPHASERPCVTVAFPDLGRDGSRD